LISPSTWISPFEVTLPVIIRSSPMMEGTSLLGPALLTYLGERSPNGVVSVTARSDILVRGSPPISRSGFFVNMTGTSSTHATFPLRRKENGALPQQKKQSISRSAYQ